MHNQKYSKQMVVLHWVSALVICWALVSGFYTGLLPVNPQIKEWVTFVNISMTTLFIPVFVLRLYVRQAHAKPAPVAGAKRLAAWVHGLIYVSVGAVLITGTLMMDHPINVFNLISLPNLVDDPQWLSRYFAVHEAGCALLGLLVALHVGAVLKHELRGTRVLRRMLF
jgi:cytochrome b561